VLPPALALAAGFATVSKESWQILPFAALAACVIGLRPALIAVVALVLCQEFATGGRSAGPSTALGNQLYFGSAANAPDGAGAVQTGPTVVPVVALLVLAAGVVVWRSRRPPGRAGLDPLGAAVLFCLVALFLWTSLSGIVASGSVLAGVNQEGKPFLILLAGFAVGFLGLDPNRPDRYLHRAVGVALVALAVLGGAGLALGTVSLDLASGYPPFYDAALPALAAAVVLALVFTARHPSPRLTFVVGVAALAIAVISLRRNVWVGAGIALVVALAITYRRAPAMRRILVAVGAAVPLLLVVPGVAAEIGTRLYDTLIALTDNADASTKGHVSDLEVGWRSALDAPLQGIGPRHAQLPGLAAADSSQIYVHNEFLLDWLRFGLVGMLLVVLLVVLLVRAAAGLLRHRTDAGPVALTAAMFVLIVPISLMTAPFLSTTSRWPALLGIAAGALLAARSRMRAASDGELLLARADDPPRVPARPRSAPAAP